MTSDVTMTHDVTITLRCRIAGDRPTADLREIVGEVATAAFVQLEAFPDEYGIATDNATVTTAIEAIR